MVFVVKRYLGVFEVIINFLLLFLLLHRFILNHVLLVRHNASLLDYHDELLNLEVINIS
jgi:hypothetical protein